VLALASVVLAACPPSLEVTASHAADEQRTWVCGTTGCGMCATKPWLALVDFGTGEVRVAKLPPRHTEPGSQLGGGARGDTPDTLRFVVASGTLVAAAGEEYCENPFEPFVVISRDGGRTFTRHLLPIGRAYSAEATGLMVQEGKAVVRIEVERTSNEDARDVLCFAIGARVAATRCPRFEPVQPVDARLRKLHLPPG
jgi:hypothetical protein